MLALLAVEFAPDADPHFAVNALRRPALVVTALDVGARDVVATVEVANAEALAAAEALIRTCPGILASATFPVEA